MMLTDVSEKTNQNENTPFLDLENQNEKTYSGSANKSNKRCDRSNIQIKFSVPNRKPLPPFQIKIKDFARREFVRELSMAAKR